MQMEFNSWNLCQGRTQDFWKGGYEPGFVAIKMGEGVCP